MREWGEESTVTTTNPVKEARAGTLELPVVPRTLVGSRGILVMEGA